MGDRIGGVIIVVAFVILFLLLMDGLWVACVERPVEYCATYGC